VLAVLFGLFCLISSVVLYNITSYLTTNSVVYFVPDKTDFGRRAISRLLLHRSGTIYLLLSLTITWLLQSSDVTSKLTLYRHNTHHYSSYPHLWFIFLKFWCVTNFFFTLGLHHCIQWMLTEADDASHSTLDAHQPMCSSEEATDFHQRPSTPRPLPAQSCICGLCGVGGNKQMKMRVEEFSQRASDAVTSTTNLCGSFFCTLCCMLPCKWVLLQL